MCPGTSVRSERSVEEALMYVEELGAHLQGLDVLITGSLHLVGGALYLLRESTVPEE